MISRSRSWGAFSELQLESQNDKKCDNFEEALVTNNGNIEFVECAYYLKSYLLCQTISTTANSHYVYDLSNLVTGKVVMSVIQLQASCFDALHYVMLLCAASLHMSVHSLLYSCVVEVTKYLFILAFCLLFG